MIRAALVALLALCALPLAGCAPAATAQPTPPQTPPQTVRLTGDDDGRVLSLRVGDTLEINLATNPSTGYTWQPVFSTWPVLDPVGEPQYQSDSGLIGSGGRATLRFRVVGPGQVQLALAYRRPGDLLFPTPQSFSVVVTVQ